MKRLMLVGMAAVAAVTAGCSAEPAKSSARCEPVSAERAASILGDEGGVQPMKASAVKSQEHSNAYYIAIRFTAPGLEDGRTVGVWASAGAIETGMVISVDAVAAEFSGISKNDQFATTDKGANEARGCV